MYKIIFVGAGVSNLVAANYLIDSSFYDFVILEKGNSLQNRKCPSSKECICHLCSKGCAIIEGVGGTNALYGNKLCYFPASDHILKKTGWSSCDKMFQYLENLTKGYIDSNFNQYQTTHDNKKEYISNILDKKNFFNMIGCLTERLKNYIVTNSNVISMSHQQEYIEVVTEDGGKYLSEYIVLGSGRSSYKFLKKCFDDNTLEYSFNTPDIGIRIETHENNFSEVYKYQADPKFKFLFDTLGSGRTFCAVNKGKVIPVKFGDTFYAEGVFDDKLGDKNNIALMVRSNNYINDEQIEAWCKNINNKGNSQLILGDVMITDNRQKMISEIINLIHYFPTAIHEELLKKLLQKVLVGEYDILNKKGSLRIYAPAIDNYWIKPNLNSNMSVNGNDRIFVIGDAAGLSRGFVQAMYSGCFWANSFLVNGCGNIQKKSNAYKIVI